MLNCHDFQLDRAFQASEEGSIPFARSMFSGESRTPRGYGRGV